MTLSQKLCVILRWIESCKTVQQIHACKKFAYQIYLKEKRYIFLDPIMWNEFERIVAAKLIDVAL